MKILSEKTGKEYASVEDCLMAEEKWEAEQAAKKAAEEKALAEAKAKKEAAAAERKAEADKVEAARQELIKAQKNFSDILTEFCKKYGAYHYTLKPGETIQEIWNDIFNNIWL
jgi:membrane protein involved in colicin uptake